MAEAKARYPDREIHLLAHSIGGWCVLSALFGPDWRRAWDLRDSPDIGRYKNGGQCQKTALLSINGLKLK